MCRHYTPRLRGPQAYPLSEDGVSLWLDIIEGVPGGVDVAERAVRLSKCREAEHALEGYFIRRLDGASMMVRQ